MIFDTAIELNQNGEYFPIWGTCLGFELLGYLATNSEEIRTDCDSNKVSLPLEFKSDYGESRMFQLCPNEVISILQTKAVTPNFHNYCITEANMTAFGLDKDWRVMSLNSDSSRPAVRFISTMEHRTFPFYGVQFHPEKTLYEYIPNRNISHTKDAIVAAQYFSRFFVEECRKSLHSFANYTEENRHLIYNFPVTFSAPTNSIYQEVYMFQEDVDYPPDNSGSQALGACKAVLVLIFTFLSVSRS